MARTPGTFGRTIRDERPAYQFGMDDLPKGFSIDSADAGAMTKAGFPRDDFARSGMKIIDPRTGNEIDAAEVRFCVLLDPDGAIVATFDGARWFTPYESARLVQDYIAGRVAR